MARWSRARWEPVPNYSGTLRPIAVTLHHQAGTGDPYSIYLARDVSAHFWIPYTGDPVQHVDTAHQSWHGVSHNAYSIGVETEGCGSPPHADPLTEHQLDLFAGLMAWAHTTHGIPLVLSEAVTQPGLNYHRCTGGPATGCPCDVRVNARAEILRRAGGTQPGPGPSLEAHEMIASTSTGKGYWTATYDGAVNAFGDAQYHGNVYEKLAPGSTIVGIAGKGADGYWLLGSDGGVFTFGSAGYFGRPDRV
jgi:hypothetical protein